MDTSFSNSSAASTAARNADASAGFLASPLSGDAPNSEPIVSLRFFIDFLPFSILESRSLD